MPNNNNGSTCYYCKRGHFAKQTREIAFHQWTDRGYVFCRVTTPVGVCSQCGALDWNEETEVAIEEAVRREYERLQ
jgi:hypothetical protein